MLNIFLHFQCRQYIEGLSKINQKVKMTNIIKKEVTFSSHILQYILQICFSDFQQCRIAM